MFQTTSLPQSLWSSSDPSAFHMTSTSNHCSTPQVRETSSLCSSLPLLPVGVCVSVNLAVCVQVSAALTCIAPPGRRGCVEARASRCSTWTKPSTQEARRSVSRYLLSIYTLRRNSYSLSPAPSLCHLSRCVCSAVGSGHRCVAGRRAAGGATTSPVLPPLELFRTGTRDTHCAQDTHTQVHTHSHTHAHALTHTL